jgi:LPXTG-motif cell wall-anchored protein
MIRRTIVLLGAALVAILVLAPAASAQYEEPGEITTDNPTPGVGDSITVQGSNCEPNTTLTLTLTQGDQSVVVGQVTTDADGNFTTTITIPTSFSPGPATLSSACGSLTLNIAGAVGALPRTGSSSSLPLARVAVVLLAVGGFLVLTARKRVARVPVDG